MVGVDPTDTWAAESGLPPVDGVNLWPLLSGKNSTSPRTEIPVDENTLIQGDYKLVLGMTKFSGWAGEKYPNASSPAHPVQAVKHDCGQSGCLFDIVQVSVSGGGGASGVACIHAWLADTPECDALAGPY